MYMPDYDFNTPKGWQCPKCGRIYSPTTPMCFYCGGKTITNQTTTGTEYPKLPTVITSSDSPYTVNLENEIDLFTSLTLNCIKMTLGE